MGVEYAGDAFEGWQSQRHGRTVQDHLERALADIAGHEVRLHCAGRTDAGVHATTQVVHFDTEAKRTANGWVRGGNSRLGKPVAIRWAFEIEPTFHARYSAIARRYRYVLYNNPVRPALLAGRVGWMHDPLDVSLMAQAAALIEGRHDFSVFRAAGCQARSPEKIMHSVCVARDGDFVIFDFHANAFLHHMVRNIVGALVYVGKGRFPPEWVAELLTHRDRSRGAPTFGPEGLYLCGVDYPPNWPLPDDGRIIAKPRFPAI